MADIIAHKRRTTEGKKRLFNFISFAPSINNEAYMSAELVPLHLIQVEFNFLSKTNNYLTPVNKASLFLMVDPLICNKRA